MSVDEELSRLNQCLISQAKEIERLNMYIVDMQASKIWRWTKSLRMLNHYLYKMKIHMKHGTHRSVEEIIASVKKQALEHFPKT